MAYVDRTKGSRQLPSIAGVVAVLAFGIAFAAGLQQVVMLLVRAFDPQPRLDRGDRGRAIRRPQHQRAGTVLDPRHIQSFRAVPRAPASGG